jgi:heme oxygenase (mycobilin-producing)
MALLSMVHLHLKGDEEHALMLLHETLIATRAREGCLRVDVVQDLDDPGHIALLETWASPQDEASYRSWRAEQPPNLAWRAFVASTPEVSNFTVRSDV